ncbi:MAG: arylsulfatase [Rikenellaceae bacterium]
MKSFTYTRTGAICLALVGVSSQFVGCSKDGSPKSPNIILINIDDLGYGCLSSFGATKVKTPNIDRLATEGRIFMDMHSASAVSTPSRYGLMTGRYPFREDVFAVAGYKTPLLINQEHITIAEVMKRSGYATAVIGKWHLGFCDQTPDWNSDLKPGPLELGFDYYFGIPTVNSGPPFVFVEDHNVVGLDPADPFVYGQLPETKVFPGKKISNNIGGAKAAHALYDDEMLGTIFTQKSVEWIKSHRDDPFFLYLATTNIHNPITPNPKFIGTSECGIYGDFIHELDWMVGEILNTLDEEGIADNTMVIFTSDNGAMLKFSGFEAQNNGLNINGELFGYKFDSWEGGHRVPMLIRWKDGIKAGTISNQLICNVDLLRSLAALVGCELEEGDAPDSYNMLPALLGETEEEIREELLSASHKRNNYAYRKGDYVYINNRGGGGFDDPTPGSSNFGGVAAAHYFGRENSDMEGGKYKEDAPKVQLYNLRNDIKQSVNLANSEPDKLKEMQAGFKRIMKSERTAP